MDPQLGTFTMMWAGIQDIFITATSSVLLGNFFAAAALIGIVLTVKWLLAKGWSLFKTSMDNQKAKEATTAAQIIAQQQLQAQQLAQAQANAMAAQRTQTVGI